MADTEDKITVRNLQAEYDRLTSEIPTKASELSLIYKDIEKAKSELKDIISRKETLDKEMSTQHASLDDRVTNLETRERESADKLALADKEHKDKLVAIKEATHDLSRINFQVLQANEEHDKHLEVLKDQQSALIVLNDIIGRIKAAELQIALLEEEKGQILLDISTIHEQSESKLKEARDELAALVHLKEQNKIEAAEAQARVKTYTDELYTKMNDYQIVKARLEGVWQKTFPELELPLT